MRRLSVCACVHQVADAVDGKDIKPNKKVSNGYVKKSWTIDGEAKIYVFQGVCSVCVCVLALPCVRAECACVSLCLGLHRFACAAAHAMLRVRKCLPFPEHLFNTLSSTLYESSRHWCASSQQ